MNKLRDMKIGNKLGTGFGVLVALLIAMTVMAIWGLSTLNNLKGLIVLENKKSMAASEVRANVRDIGNRLATIVLARDKAHMEETQRGLAPLRANYAKKMEELKAMSHTKEGKDKLAAVEQSITEAREVNVKLVELALAGNTEEAVQMLNVNSVPLMEKVYSTVHDMRTWREQQMADDVKEAESLYSKLRWMLVLSGVLAILIAVFFSIVITRSIVGPVRKGLEFAASISQGDMTQTLKIEQKDEIGDLAKALNEMRANIHRMVADIGGCVQTLASSSTELSTVSAQMAYGVKDMSESANGVAAAAEESSANTVSVAASMEQATTNLSSVASATEEMSATVGEIASNSEKARAISSDATVQAQAVSTMMKELGRAAQEIGQVTETITSISAQTNLLALNATIEAARAGAAGKGFAVVANEIKELAQQTAAATEDIKGKIASIQASTGGAIGDIEKIAQVIKQVEEIVANIAAAIEEQSAVTRDVASNISQASMGMQDSNERVGQTATVSQSIAEDIARVTATISRFTRNNECVQSNAEDLLRLREAFESLIGRFKLNNDGTFDPGPIKMAHQAWVSRAANLLAGKQSLDASEVTDHHLCKFGKWYYGEGTKECGHLDIFKSLESPHAEIHAKTREIAQFVATGKRTEASAKLQELMTTSRGLCQKLDQLAGTVNVKQGQSAG
ncbi:MAG: methyl-accepting chemotaxis protein [Syntrophobacteraceae bacterium]|jgi:methyl-accepting chemotaxis protein